MHSITEILKKFSGTALVLVSIGFWISREIRGMRGLNAEQEQLMEQRFIGPKVIVDYLIRSWEDLALKP